MQPTQILVAAFTKTSYWRIPQETNACATSHIYTWHSVWQRLFSLLRKVDVTGWEVQLGEAYESKMPTRFHTPRCTNGSIFVVVYNQQRYSPGKKNKCQRTFLTQCTFYISCWKPLWISSFKRNFHVWVEVEWYKEWPQEQIRPSNQTVAQEN
jgi:hypothetical protein